MMQRKRVCDLCQNEILPGAKYVRTGAHLLSDEVDRRHGMAPSTTTTILAQLEREYCLRCAPPLEVAALEQARAATR